MIEIAKVLKAHGIRGELKTQLFSDNIESFCDRGYAYVKDGGKYRRIDFTPVRVAPPFVYLQIDGVQTRNDAEQMRGVFLYLKREEFDDLDEGEYYVKDLVGLRVEDSEGNTLGRLTEVLQHGAADVYVVKGERNFMFPALNRVLLRVDVVSGEMVVDAHALSEVAVYED